MLAMIKEDELVCNIDVVSIISTNLIPPSMHEIKNHLSVINKNYKRNSVQMIFNFVSSIDVKMSNSIICQFRKLYLLENS